LWGFMKVEDSPGRGLLGPVLFAITKTLFGYIIRGICDVMKIVRRSSAVP
jgi:hypothetical protein